MHSKNHLDSISKTKEQITSKYSVSFLSSSHPDAKNIKTTYDTLKLVAMLNTWWTTICTKNNIDTNDQKLQNIAYYIMELGKNALEHAGGGEIKVIFEPTKITVIVTDQGQGFEDLDNVNYYSSEEFGHGLYEINQYADKFYIESKGKKYAKIKGKTKLTEIGTSNVTTGSKITFIKNLNNTSPNGVYKTKEKVR